MSRSRRPAALMLLVAAMVALLATPAQAAPGEVEAEISLRNLTLPAGGGTVEERLFALLLAERAGWASKLTLTVDTSDVAVADVAVDGQCSAGPVKRCVMPGPHQVFRRPEGDGTFSFITTDAGLPVSLTPKPGTSAGDTGTLTVTAQVDDGPVTTETATIRIGEGVNLTAVDDKARTVAPGAAAEMRPRVRNSGTTEVDGLTAVIYADDGVLADTDFGNCTYSYAIACTFDTSLTAGDTYRMSAPFTVATPRDAVTGSQTSLNVQWLTAAEWEDQQADYADLPDGRPGTGPDLTLEQVAASAASVPQADTDHDDNGSSTLVTVRGGRRTDVVAVGATLPGTPGGRHTIDVGLVNDGPGALRYPPFFNNVAAVYVTMPPGVSVMTADERCTSLTETYPAPPSFSSPAAGEAESAGFGPAEYYCGPRAIALPADRRLTFTFEVRITRAAHEGDGSVELSVFDNDAVDRDPRNNRAPITLNSAGGGGGLPITGTTATRAAGLGTLLVLIGSTVIIALRRRALPGP